MRYIILFSAMFLSACAATQTATPLGNNKYRIDVSAPPSYDRAQTQQLSTQKAAEVTLEQGYDRFIVLSGKSWTETEVYRDTYGTFSHDPYYDPHYANGNFTTSLTTVRNPESTMVIKLYKNGDKGADKGVDARAYLDSLAKK